MTYNFAIASVIGAVEAMRVAAKFNIVAALCGYTLLLLLNLAVPFASRWLCTSSAPMPCGLNVTS